LCTKREDLSKTLISGDILAWNYVPGKSILPKNKLRPELLHSILDFGRGRGYTLFFSRLTQKQGFL
jgi:hypothetical protein